MPAPAPINPAADTHTTCDKLGCGKPVRTITLNLSGEQVTVEAEPATTAVDGEQPLIFAVGALGGPVPPRQAREMIRHGRSVYRLHDCPGRGSK